MNRIVWYVLCPNCGKRFAPRPLKAVVVPHGDGDNLTMARLKRAMEEATVDACGCRAKGTR